MTIYAAHDLVSESGIVIYAGTEGKIKALTEMGLIINFGSCTLFRVPWPSDLVSREEANEKSVGRPV